MVYDLYNINKDCKIIELVVSTKDSYDTKSAGYNFGTDISKKETRTKTRIKTRSKTRSKTRTTKTLKSPLGNGFSLT